MQGDVACINCNQQLGRWLRTWEERASVAGRVCGRDGNRVFTADLALIKNGSVEYDVGREGIERNVNVACAIFDTIPGLGRVGRCNWVSLAWIDSRRGGRCKRPGKGDIALDRLQT